MKQGSIYSVANERWAKVRTVLSTLKTASTTRESERARYEIYGVLANQVDGIVFKTIRARVGIGYSPQMIAEELGLELSTVEEYVNIDLDGPWVGKSQSKLTPSERRARNQMLWSLFDKGATVSAAADMAGLGRPMVGEVYEAWGDNKSRKRESFLAGRVVGRRKPDDETDE